jgi:predicted RNase H-like HicB family nuclease
MHRFLIVIEKAGKNYSAYSPDLPGCVATGKTRDEAEERMHDAIGMHVRRLVEDGLPVPKLHSSSSIVAVPAEQIVLKK